MKKSFAKFFMTACTMMLAVTFSLFSTVGFAADTVHKHSFSTEWSKGEKNHYHASTCEHNIVRDVEPHNFVGGKCSECGYVKPTVHTHTYSNAWESDSVNHWHAADCEHSNVVRDMAKHNYKDGKCTVCGHPAPAEGHVHTFASAWTYDDVNHWHTANCGDKMVADMAAHSTDGKKCTVCGYKVPEPPHEHTYSEWVMASDGKHYQTCTGNGCTDPAGTKYNEDTHDTDGANSACSVCGYKAPHTHTPGGWVNTDPTGHYKTCTDPACDNPTAKIEEGEHNTNGKDGVEGACSVCGYKAAPVQHTHTPGGWVNTDPTGHYKRCTDPACDNPTAKIEEGEHNTNGKDGVEGACSVCGYKAPHTHTPGGWVNTDPEQHYKQCTDPNCDNPTAKIEEGGHNTDGKDGVEGACSVCGYKATSNPPDDSGIELTASGTYGEGIYVEWSADNKDGYTVSYQKNGDSNWTDIDGELIRTVATGTGTVRADIVGIKAGTYKVKVANGTKQTVKENLTVSALDRSGYAHFNYTSGVGAYKDDGTPKNNALIIYVNESNKNTVTATISGKTYTGIANILSNANKCSNPIIVRVVGCIKAATWKEGNVTYTKGSGNLTEDKIVGKNGTKLPTDSNSLTQAALIAGGYNELQDDISELIGLSSKAIYSSDKKEYDSCWNNCSISEASNVTVEGIGTDAEIFQWGFTWSKCNSIEVRNLTFTAYTEDACSFEGNVNKTVASQFQYKNFWVHHNTFNRGVNYWDVCPEQDKKDGDGSVDLKRLANVTLAYNHFYNTHKTNLIGADDDVCTANITLHHNYYENCQSRLPLARVANMHMYNNYYMGVSSSGLSIRAGGYAFVEYCYFENSKKPVAAVLGTKTLADAEGTSKKRQGFIKLYNCHFDSKSTYDASDYILVTNDRAARQANDNIYNDHFDTDSSDFYYENGASKVTNLITDVSEIPTQIPKLAGTITNSVD